MQHPQNQIAELIQRLNMTANGYRPAILLLTANQQGLFALLSGRKLSSPDIAAQLHWDNRAAAVFLNALAALGFLQKSNNLFFNAEITEKLLVPGQPFYQGDILKHSYYLWDRWAQVGDVLSKKRGRRKSRSRREGDELHAFIAGMANLAQLSGFPLWQKVNLAGRKSLLDLGGGPGTLSFLACEAYPELRAVVLDLPEVEPIFHEFRAKSPAGNRVDFQAGDFLLNSLPGGFDVALLSSIIHSHSFEDNRQLVKAVYDGLDPGGMIIIKDFFISEDGAQPPFAALFAVNMLLGTQAGGCYTPAQVESWLQETGFGRIEHFDLDAQSGLITAVRV
jgi:SAM-dependent methyltransferase